MARVELLMSVTKCSRGTALRWLGGKTVPQNGVEIVRIAGALDVDPSWLAGVAASDPLLSTLTRAFMRLPQELRIEAVLHLDRLALNADRAKG